MNFSAALPTFVVTLREGFEAALVVGIVFACLTKSQQTNLNRWVYLGISGGIVASIMVGWLLGNVLQGVDQSHNFYAPVVKQLLEGIFGLVAILMLTWMLLWMSQQAKHLKTEVETAINKTLIHNHNAGKGIFLLVFIAVLREGLETVLFIVAKFQQAIFFPALGAFAGLILASLMGFILFSWGIKINIRLFFQVMGVLLLLIVGGLVIGVLRHFDASVTILGNLNPMYQNWCLFTNGSCLLGIQVWNGSHILPDAVFPGILLKTLFGYREQLYLIQVIVYALFLIIIGRNYFFALKDRAKI
jgi:high-affinity iron transporter